MNPVILYLVLPCYNEEEVLPETASRLEVKMNDLIQKERISPQSVITFVNDGSADRTWNIISDFHNRNPLFEGIDLTRNKGHQNALLAGLMTVKDKADIVISLDADLQDDINAIDEMVEKFYEGNDIVYGVRSERKTDTKFKKFTAEAFYKLMAVLGVELVFNHADYRLMSKRALEDLAEYKEVNIFLRGVVPQIGYKTAEVSYERSERFAGESKYPLKKMFAFAVDGITSFSVKPIRFVTLLGFLMIFVAIGVMLYSLISFFTGRIVSGWTSLIMSIWIVGGVVMISLGVIGEYVGKIYLESKERPRYSVKEWLTKDDK